MKKFNEWCNIIDTKLQNFNFMNFLYFLFPMFFQKKPLETLKSFVYETKVGQPIIIRSDKHIENNGSVYGTNIANTSNAIHVIKESMKREICEEIMKSDLIEWQYQDTPFGTKISARLIINNFNKK